MNLIERAIEKSFVSLMDPFALSLTDGLTICRHFHVIPNRLLETPFIHLSCERFTFLVVEGLPLHYYYIVSQNLAAFLLVANFSVVFSLCYYL